MALQLVIAGRHPVPKGKESLYLSLEHDGECDDDEAYCPDEGGLDMWEDDGDNPDFEKSVAKVVGFEPASIVLIRPAGWEMSELVADVVARAFEGVVFFFGYDGEAHVESDRRGEHAPVANRRELLKRIRTAFANPGPFFAAREALESESTPSPRTPENDWSDV
jgi:hypothetical protein